MSYIKNLDGIRAFAVAGVVAFHLSEVHLPGGFVGVDVFFVISGFIITRRIRASGDGFAFGGFYARRMARLIPAATVTIIATLIASVALLAPADRTPVAETALAALAFLSNVFFTLEAGYFDDALAGNPLLHFWSLSVEEQFYLVWPFLIVGLRHLGATRAARWIVALTLAAIATSWWGARVDPIVFFYAMPLRAFQFLLGACLVYIGARPRSRMLNELTFASGISCIGFSFIAANGSDYSFLVAALLPALGTTAMILSIDGRLADALLGSAPVRALGRSAYSIYLTHWPIIVFYRLTVGAIDSLGEMLMLATASIATGWALRMCVETPLRLGPNDPRKRTKLGFVAGLVLVASVLSGAIWCLDGGVAAARPGPRDSNAISIDRLASSDSHTPRTFDLQALKRQRRGSRAIAMRCQLLEGAALSSLDLEKCLEGHTLLVGDSWVPGALVALEAAGIDASRVAVLGGAACGHITSSAAGGRHPGCRELVDFRRGLMSDGRYDTIVLAVNWTAWRERDLRPAFDALRATGKRIVVLSDRPFFDAKVPTLLGARSMDAAKTARDLTPHLDPKAERAARVLRGALADYPDFVFVDQRRVLCPAGCPAFTPEGHLIYLDRGHLTLAGARWVGEALQEELQQILR